MVKTKSANSSPFDKPMLARLEHKLLDECVKYQMLMPNIPDNKLKVSVL